MPENQLELSSDLEWMLSSGQVEQATLIHGLVNEEFSNLYEFALSILEDPASSREAAKEALCRAVLNAHDYNSQVGVQSWLRSLTRDACRAHPAPSQNSGQGIAEFSPAGLDEIAAEIQDIVESRSKRIRRSTAIQQITLIAVASVLVIFVGRTLDQNTPLPQPTTPAIQKFVPTAVVEEQPTPEPTSTPTPFPERAILYEAGSGDTLAQISNQVGIDVRVLFNLNAIPPDQELNPGQRVVIGIGGPPLMEITPTPIRPAPEPESLTTQSSFEEIYQRIQTSGYKWHTLWAEALEIDYGPEGYVGQSRIRRIQVWISRPWYELLLIGDWIGGLSEVRRTVFDKVYSLDLGTGKRSLSNSGTLASPEVVSSMLYPPLNRYPSTGKIENLSIERVAGRESLLFDWYALNPFVDDAAEQRQYLGRFWVDASTGVILRWQQFTQDDSGLLLKDLIVLDIAFDQNLSNALFDQYQPFPTEFTSDYRGTSAPPRTTPAIPNEVVLAVREPSPKITPPADFDPSRSRLTFEWSQRSSFESDQVTSVDVFADDFYLGQVPLGRLDGRAMCDRSPSGELLAYSEWLPGGEGTAPARTTPLRWFSLSNLERVYQPLPQLGAYDFAFSPDSRQLALIACENEILRDCWLYLIDTNTKEAEKILDLYAGESLVWKPDGEQIALMGILNDNEMARPEVVVLQARTGEIVYRGWVHWRTNVPPADAPTHGWRVEFPAWRLGLEKCKTAP